MSDHGPVVIGVDVGGTKVAAGCVVDGRVEHAVELPTRHGSARAVVDDMSRAIDLVIDAAGAPDAVGVGVPSQVDVSGRVVSSVNIPLAGVELAAELEARAGVPVFVDNDANCAALAEAELTGDSYLVMYTLGTGVGGGVVIGGRIYRGATGLGAELGHVVVQADGPECPGACPNRGCVEAFCSGTALERDAAEAARSARESRLAQIAARGTIRGHDVVAAARAGDGVALGLFERLGTWLGVALAGAVNAFEPQRIVIGGGLSTACDLFLDEACREARRRALPALAERVEIAAARCGPQAGIIGAGLLASHELEAGKAGAAAAANRVIEQEGGP
jgi:glucokinase